MGPIKLSKRDFLKAATLTTLAYGWNTLNPAPAFAAAIRRVSRGKGPGWDRIREQFPLSHDRVYFNNGTLGPSPSPVLAAVITAMEKIEATGETRDADGAALRLKLADFVGAKAEEIALTHNTTEGINIVAEGLRLHPGDEVIITTHEHVGNALPWLNRARLGGITLKTFRPPPTALGVLQEIAALITDRTRVIAIPHLSCTTGQVFPVEEIVKFAEPRKVLVFVDGAHGTGMLPLNLNALGAHFYASSTHKWLCGPKGVGYLYVRKDMLDQVEPRFVGAHSDVGWSLESHPPRIDGFAPSARRFEYGSQNTALYVGACAAIDFFDQIGMEKITEHGCALALQLQNALARHADAIEILTPVEARSRAMMISFRFRNPGKDSVRFAGFASQNGFRVRQVAEAGLGAIRVSTHLYNSSSEVDRFTDVVEAFIRLPS